jgi:hypothetical protein
MPRPDSAWLAEMMTGEAVAHSSLRAVVEQMDEEAQQIRDFQARLSSSMDSPSASFIEHLSRRTQQQRDIEECLSSAVGAALDWPLTSTAQRIREQAGRPLPEHPITMHAVFGSALMSVAEEQRRLNDRLSCSMHDVFNSPVMSVAERMREQAEQFRQFERLGSSSFETHLNAPLTSAPALEEAEPRLPALPRSVHRADELAHSMDSGPTLDVTLTARCAVCDDVRVWRPARGRAAEDEIAVEVMPSCATCAEWSADDPVGFMRAYRLSALDIACLDGGKLGDGVPRGALYLVKPSALDGDSDA